MDVNARLEQAIGQHQAGDLAGAEAGYRALLNDAPDHAEALHFLGVLLRQQNRREEGLELLRRSVELAPGRATFHYHFGYALDEDGRCEEAAACYRKAIELQPGAARAWMNLGIALQTLGRHPEAREALEKTVELAPASATARFNLARVLETLGQCERATDQLREAMRIEKSPQTLVWLGSILRRYSDLEEAARIAAELVAIAPHDPAAWMEAGHTHAAAGRKEEARAAYARAVQLSPDDPDAAFFLAMAEGRTPERSPKNFLVEMYDGYADHFDQHLRGTLGYSAPERVRDAVMRVLEERGPAPPLDIFDAGCGTGLSAPLFAPLARRLVGVDLSPAMIAQARALQRYTELAAGDLVEHLHARPGEFDLVLAVDVLIHMGDLRPAFEAAARALRPGGLLAFTVEEGEGGPAGYELQANWRFRHSPRYLRETAAGFVERLSEKGTFRKERGQDVPGLCMVLERGSA